MEALALMLIHFLLPNGLPWSRYQLPRTNLQYDTLVRMKLNTRAEELCRGIPSVFKEFLRYCRALKFMEQPDYLAWIGRFADLLKENGHVGSDGSASDLFYWPPRPRSVTFLLYIFTWQRL